MLSGKQIGRGGFTPVPFRNSRHELRWLAGWLAGWRPRRRVGRLANRVDGEPCRANADWPCSRLKGNRLPEELSMSLTYLPCLPSLHDDMTLRGRRILADRMELLLESVPRQGRLHG